jgi:Flp pilus assembly protein TadG
MNQRRGSLAVELLIVLPVLLGILLGMVEFSMLLVSRQELLTASREGARVAAIGGSQADVEAAVRQFLGAGSLSQATITTVLADNQGQPLPSGSPVAVTVSIPATQAAPDLLVFIGFSLRGENLIAQTVMRKE